MSRVLIFSLLLFVTAGGCGNDKPEASGPATGGQPTIPFRKDATLAVLRGGEPVVSVDVEIAATDSARTRGMMQREGFPTPTSGMLFLFETSEIQSFWMANTPVALDLLFIGPDSQIVDIHRYARPFSTESITSAAPARYVLEVPAGFADRYGVSEFDRVRW